MTAHRPLSRRHVIGGLGAAGAATATGFGLPGMAFAADGVAASPRDLPNPIVQDFSASDFMPGGNDQGNLVWGYYGTGSVRVTTGGETFSCGLRLPAGAVITGARFVILPNGAPRPLNLVRHRVIPPATETVASATSTSGFSSEVVPLAVNHTIEAGWAYRFEIFLTTGGAVLYGAQVTYTIPPDPPYPGGPAPVTGVFVPFSGSNPRVYDSRTGAGKLAANEERVIPLGVPGSVRAAVFNITVTETQTAGFVACFKADTTWPGNSSVNWYQGGANTANLVVCAVDTAGAIKIRGGNDSTHVVIDLIGTFA